jgi:hypothetical protein
MDGDPAYQSLSVVSGNDGRRARCGKLADSPPEDRNVANRTLPIYEVYEVNGAHT